MTMNFNHPYNNQGSIERLYRDYLKYDTLYIAFDFDNTIWDFDNAKTNYSDNIEFAHKNVIDILKKCKKHGFKLILWTSCPKIEDEITKNDICKSWGIDPDYINWSPLSPGATKPHFSLLLDDRAGLESAMYILDELFKRIENK